MSFKLNYLDDKLEENYKIERGKKMKLRLVAILIAIILLMQLVSGCKEKETAKQDPIKNVKTVNVSKSSIILKNDYAGEVKASEEVSVVPKISGKANQVMVDIGTNVSKGDILFTIDSSDIMAQYNQAKAGVEIAKVNLKRAGGSGFTQSLIQAKTSVEQTRLSYEDAKLNYDKKKILFDQGAESKHELEAYETRMLAAKEQYDNASENLKLLKEDIGPDSVDGAQAQLKQAEAALQLIQAQLNNTSITAPISGVVSKRNVNSGEGVSPASPSIVISKTGDLVAEINITEKLINKVEIGQNIPILIESLNNKTYQGQVNNISPVADPKTRDYTVKIKLSNIDNKIKPGMFAKIKMVVENKNGVIAVPNQALISENGLQYAYIVKENKIKKTPVKIGISNDEVTEVVQGIIEGDSLIPEGQSFLTEGEKVNIVK